MTSSGASHLIGLTKSCQMEVRLIDQFGSDGGNSLINNKDERIKLLKEAAAQKFAPREIVTCIACAKTFFKPSDAFDFILEIASYEDGMVWDTARNALESFINDENAKTEIDFDGIIENFPMEEETVRKGLLLHCIPIPVKQEHLKFIYRCAMSVIPMNRCAFLALLNRVAKSEAPIEKRFHDNAVQCLDIMGSDPSPCVLCQWIEPAMFYLRETQRRRLIIGLNHMIHHQDPEVRTAVALHFKEVYELTKEVSYLLGDKVPRVIAALIPGAAALENELSGENLKSIFQFHNHIIQVLIFRHFTKIPDHVIKDVMSHEESSEVITDLIRWIGRQESAEKWIPKIIQGIKFDENNWRRDFEILALPVELLIRIGKDRIFEFAMSRSKKHPQKLMKQAVYVLCEYARRVPAYDIKLRKHYNDLMAEETEYGTMVARLIDELRTNAAQA